MAGNRGHMCLITGPDASPWGLELEQAVLPTAAAHMDPQALPPGPLSC